MMKRIALPFLFALTFFAIPSVASAQRRSPLADAPAIRKRLELRQTRFEVGAGIGTSVNAIFYHGLTANVRLGFHITDWLSLSAVGGFGIAQIPTGFHDRLITSLEPTDPRPVSDRRAPLPSEANSSLNKATMFGAAQLEFTPFTGKYSFAGKLFAHYDFYLFGGAALMNFAAANGNADPACSSTAATSGRCTVTGMQFGATFGGGFHSFFNDFVALNVELRNIHVRDNPAGRDVNGDMDADKDDLTWTPHIMAMFGVTLYLPATASVSP